MLLEHQSRVAGDFQYRIAVRMDRLRLDTGGGELRQPGIHPFPAHDGDRDLVIGESGACRKVQFLDVLSQQVLESEGQGLGNAAGALHGHVDPRAQHADRRDQDDGAPPGAQWRCVAQRARGGRQHAGAGRVHDGPFSLADPAWLGGVVGDEADDKGFTHGSCRDGSIRIEGPQAGAHRLAVALQETVHSGLCSANSRGHG